MKKVYLKAYVNCNLGDDLFIYMIANRYKNVLFNINSSTNYNIIFNNNVNHKKYHFFEKVINKIVKEIFKIPDFFEYICMKKNSMTILIGGSMFIERKNFDYKYLIGGGKPYYILGSNFGPYNTQKYYNKFYEIFKKAEDVCFRDYYSYNLFKDLNNIRCAPDIIYGINIDDIEICSQKKVLFSVIDCDQKIDKIYTNIYEEKIISMINYFKKVGYNITLMSFCENEGDELAIDRIIKKIGDTDKIDTYLYRGNINEALNVIGKCEIVVGSRFHANILGLVMNKTIIPIAYSDKTINVLRDIEFGGKIIDIRNMEKFNVNDLEDSDLKYKLNVDLQKERSEKHFEKLDKILK